MKIFLISNMYPSDKAPDYGVFVRNIEECLVKNGAEISNKSVIDERKSGVFQKIITYLYFYFHIAKNYYFGRYDLIYVHFISHTAPVLFVLSLLSVKKRVWVINVHGSDVLTHNKGVLKYFIIKAVSFSDLLVVPSTYFSHKVKELFPFYRESGIYVSPSGGIDSSIFHPLNVPKQNEKLIFGFVSRIESDKGWRVFLESLKQLKKSGFEFSAMIVGTGSEVQDMLDLIKKDNLEKFVKYLGIVPQKELTKIYNKLDVFVFPTERESESLGLVGLEAMACGVPVIGSNMAGIKTYVEDGVNGFLFEPGNTEELTQKIINYSELNSMQKITLINNALETAKLYDNKIVAHNLYKRFELLLEKN